MTVIPIRIRGLKFTQAVLTSVVLNDSRALRKKCVELYHNVNTGSPKIQQRKLIELSPLVIGIAKRACLFTSCHNFTFDTCFALNFTTPY